MESMTLPISRRYGMLFELMVFVSSDLWSGELCGEGRKVVHLSRK
jgi:hypothetical protein